MYVNQCPDPAEGMILHYRNLQEKTTEKNKIERKQRVAHSSETMCIRYIHMTNNLLSYPFTLYNSFVDDRNRKIITRWRLSSHQLRIETGRRSQKYIEQALRTCKICDIIEDESHALFHCTAHVYIRQRHEDLLKTYPSVVELFNPKVDVDIQKVGKYLREIETNMVQFEMVQ